MMEPGYLERYYAYFKNCNCPDESFFQTLMMNSSYADRRMDYLHYVEWPEGMNNPKVLTMDDYHKLVVSEKLMAIVRILGMKHCCLLRFY